MILILDELKFLIEIGQNTTIDLFKNNRESIYKFLDNLTLLLGSVRNSHILHF